MNFKLFSLLGILLIISSCKSTDDKNGVISGELKKWHRVTVTFDGPETSETDSVNPFLDYRMLVTFRHHDKRYLVPGFYAADGNAAETGAESGNKWRVHFCPDEEGTWQYKVSYRKGINIAVNEDPMAGGGGVEWYFGYNYPDNDLGCEDWRSRDLMWDQTKYALGFFQNHLPFWKMKPMDDLTTSENDYCFALEGEMYAIYLPEGGTTQIDLSDQEGDYIVNWYNPRKGGELQSGSISRLSGGEMVEIGFPPDEVDEDWVAVLALTI